MPLRKDPFLRRRETGPRGRLLAATLLAVLLFAADLLTGGSLRALARAAVTHVYEAVARVEHIVFGGYFSSKASLIAQNQALTEELAQYEERAAQARALESDNASLREMAHLAASVPGVTAPVVSSTRTSPYGTFLIGAGSAEGILRGQLVATEGGFVVGRIADVAEHTSLVHELFAPDESVEAVAASASLQLVGRGGGNARAQAPRGLMIEIGTPVFAPGLGGRTIGIVGSVASSSASASEQIFVRLPVNLEALRYVYVIH